MINAAYTLYAAFKQYITAALQRKNTLRLIVGQVWGRIDHIKIVYLILPIIALS